MQSLKEDRIEPIPVRMGEVKVGTDSDVLQAVGLGSCVGVALYDPRTRIAGLAHVMLPHPSSGKRAVPPGRFAATAVEFLIDHMLVTGAERRRLFARLVGGAAMFEAVLADEGGPSLGQRNVEAARDALARANIPLKGEAVGGNFGRTVNFFAEDGRIVITSVRNADVIL